MASVNGRRLGERNFAQRILVGSLCAMVVLATFAGTSSARQRATAIAHAAPDPDVPRAVERRLVLEDATKAPAPLDPPAAPAIRLAVPGPRAGIGMKWVGQTWNNCGPASVVMALSALGIDVSQETARLALRGEDIRRGMPATNIDPWVAASFGLRALLRTNGTADLLKRLVANGFPVLVTQWLEDPPGIYATYRIAHYRVVRGWDESRRAFVTNDPYRGAQFALDYASFDRLWQPFVYRYLVIYRPADEAKLRAILGSAWDEGTARERAYLRLRAEAEGRRDVYAWSAYGEAAYRAGYFAEAVAAFQRALAIGWPDGLYTFRSSYPAALRALGRAQEAQAALAVVNRVIPYPMDLLGVDPVAIEMAEDRHPRPRTDAIAQ